MWMLLAGGGLVTFGVILGAALVGMNQKTQNSSQQGGRL